MSEVNPEDVCREEMPEGLKLLAEGRISVGRAAELLNTSLYRVHEIAAGYGVELGASAEDHRRSRNALDERLWRLQGGEG